MTIGIMFLHVSRAPRYVFAPSLLLLCLISPVLVVSISVESYGAIGDGVTDNTVALNAAFSKAAPGSTLEIPAGRTYAHNDLVHIVVPGLHIHGGGRLLATNERRSGVWMWCSK
jgi:Pectate lyase superfamily protein